MANDTKERILVAALEMFSQNGYAGTNIRELSASLGLVKSGVYKHYESKEAIWNALLDEMIAYYGEHFGSPEHLPPVPDSPEGLVTMTMQMVNFTVHLAIEKLTALTGDHPEYLGWVALERILNQKPDRKSTRLNSSHII